MRYIDAFLGGYSGYFNYLISEVTQPHWYNYFYWLIGVSLFVFILEICFPWRKNQGVFRKDFFLDLFYMFFNFFLFSLIIYNALSEVVVLAFHDFLAFFGIKNLVAIKVGQLSTPLQLFILFIIRDFTHFNIHRLLHKVPFLWNYHKVHHSVKQMGFAAHLRYHWAENIFYKTLEYIPLAMVGFGIDDFFIVHIFTLFIGHLNHANIYLPLGPFKYIFNSPQMHIWHHAKALPKDRYGVNFGLTLSIWDYLFKTNYIPKNGRDTVLGFKDDEHFAKSFTEQASPFL